MFDTPMVFLKIFLQKVDFEKKSADDNKSMKNYPACKELRINLVLIFQDRQQWKHLSYFKDTFGQGARGR